METLQRSARRALAVLALGLLASLGLDVSLNGSRFTGSLTIRWRGDEGYVRVDVDHQPNDAPEATSASQPGVAPSGVARPVPGSAPTGTPRDALARQFALLQRGDAEALAACFTPAVRPTVTTDRVRSGRAAFGRTSFDALDADPTFEVGSVVCVVRSRRAGLLFARMVARDGEWLADTVWFD